MSQNNTIPAEQAAIRANCFHPSRMFVEFSKKDIEQSIPARFESIVADYPERPAIITKDRTITFAELNSLANRRARAFADQQKRAIGPIAILLENGIDQIATLLGVLKAGSFFSLLDPSQPAPKLRTILERSAATTIVTDQQYLSKSQEAAGSHHPIVNVSTISSTFSPDNLHLQIAPTDLASVAYTSGSTGVPKGVMQNHRNLLHSVSLYTNSSHICHQDRFSLLFSGTANAQNNILVALLNGAALLPFDIRRAGASAFAIWLANEKITFCWLTTPLFRTLCESLADKQSLASLRLLRVTTECYKSDLDLFKATFAFNCILFRGFSSSETGLVRSFFIDHATVITSNSLPVGYVVEDKEVVIINDMGKIADSNETGEIVVKSRYLSPGYWRNAQATQERFRPVSTRGDERLYFSGDLGQCLTDGNLHYLGRKDFQAKIFGYNVSLLEIEAALLAHPQVKHAGAKVWIRDGKEKFLAAYVVRRDNSELLSGELRNFLKKMLPAYMIPSTFMFLTALPLTSGKLDRNALPLPNTQRPELPQPYTAPKSDIEVKLARIWAEVLCLERVGIFDNFFDLGGHSLAASRILAHVIKQFRLDLPLQSLFESPTVAKMAIVISQHCDKPLSLVKLENILTELESLTEADAQRLLVDHSPTKQDGD